MNESLFALLGVVGEDLSLSVVVDLAVLAVDEVSAGLDLDLFGGALGRVRSHHGDVSAAPVDDERLADEEEHDGDLRDGEEAPDGGLLHEVVRQQRGQHGPEEEQENALQNHALLLPQREEWREHEEGVDGGAHYVVGGVRHGHGPAQVPHGLGLEGAQVVSAQPLS